MIDFRYHLISIIAVLLALAIGILAGSGFLGGPLLADLKHRLNNIADNNTGLQKDVAALRKTAQQDQSFAQETEPWLVQRALAGRPIVVFEVQGTDNAASDAIAAAVATAGGRVVSTVTFTDKFNLADPTALNQLALASHSTSGAARKVRDQTAVLLGQRAAAASHAAESPPSKITTSAQRFEDLLGELEKDGFVTSDRVANEATVPPGSLFVVLAGAADLPPFPARSFCLALSRALGRSGTVLAAEPATSTWGFVAAIRSDAKLGGSVATVDNADTVTGGIAVVLGLKEAVQGRIGHYGFGPGADAAIPQPSLSPS